MAADPEPSPPPIARPFLEFRPLLRAVGIASDGKKLILAAVGLLALWAGWSGLDRLFGEVGTGIAQIRPTSVTEGFHGPIPEILFEIGSRMAEPYRVVVMPFVPLFQRGAGASLWFRSASMAVWSIAVWGIFGGAIARIAVVQAADGRRVGVGSALRFSLSKSVSLIGAPLTPMFAVVIFSTICAGVGLIYRIPWGVGATVAAFLGFVPLLFGLVMALILAGLAAGWPMMIATVAAENEDAPDALSRSYSYVNQRLARYASHVVAAWVIGSAGLILVIAFAGAVVALSEWGVSLGASDPLPSTALSEPVRLFWIKIVGWLVHGWIYSFFWSAASIIYLILRRDVDGTEWYDVYLPEHAADTFAADLEPELPKDTPSKAAAELG